ncbi:MAG: hypothetical protein Q7J44_14235 [Pseudotabrizicola sp.]|uniref:DUF6950 family protein n=1 Tax=Pseudotabrizicola sp. TaxID=2939647 RepID=UPI00271D3E3F|nr:hypothetical protein [Pseudotabrizicola sp.]MDO9639695.1 hypothetical protein [Pseudotabrizicola sp.]
MTRRPDWQARLTGYLIGCARAPYQLGQHDCALFAAGAVEAVTGSDPAYAWRGRYATKAEGFRALKRAGHTDHIAATAAALPEIDPVFAAPGDIACVADPQAGGLVLGVVQGELIYVLREDGLGLLPHAAMQRAFRT